MFTNGLVKKKLKHTQMTALSQSFYSIFCCCCCFEFIGNSHKCVIEIYHFKIPSSLDSYCSLYNVSAWLLTFYVLLTITFLIRHPLRHSICWIGVLTTCVHNLQCNQNFDACWRPEGGLHKVGSCCPREWHLELLQTRYSNAIGYSAKHIFEK